jgi:hypothetical protein
MSSTKEAQAARNAADRRLREAFPEQYAAIMREEHEARGLTWKRRATPEERARRDAEAKQAAAKARIMRDAEKAGIDVFFGAGQDDSAEDARLDDEAPVTDAERAVLANEHVSTAIKETFEGTGETVAVDYRA